MAELFAGVGGFRLGLEACNASNKHFEIVWSNEFNPKIKTQYASMVYSARFGNKNHINLDISNVPGSTIPSINLLTAGFPCQDYSVANTLKYAKGLNGKKGQLWWEVHRMVKEKRPHYLLLENVPRLLASPSKQRGSDFATILKSLDNLGYSIEWRIIDASNLGFPQRRKRVFIFAYHNSSPIYRNLIKENATDWLTSLGIFARTLKITNHNNESIFCLTDFIKIAGNSTKEKIIRSPFKNTGICINGKIITMKTVSEQSTNPQLLRDILIDPKKVAKQYRVSETDLPLWKYHKGGKSIQRTTKDGNTYNYTEGAMSFPDSLEKPSRTIITSEGGKSPSRTRHIIKDSIGFRRLTTIELERLNGFPDNFTQRENISDSRRAFLMGNALVIGVVKHIGKALINLTLDTTQEASKTR